MDSQWRKRQSRIHKNRGHYSRMNRKDTSVGTELKKSLLRMKLDEPASRKPGPEKRQALQLRKMTKHTRPYDLGLQSSSAQSISSWISSCNSSLITRLCQLSLHKTKATKMTRWVSWSACCGQVPLGSNSVQDFKFLVFWKSNVLDEYEATKCAHCCLPHVHIQWCENTMLKYWCTVRSNASVGLQATARPGDPFHSGTNRFPINLVSSFSLQRLLRRYRL